MGDKREAGQRRCKCRSIFDETVFVDVLILNISYYQAKDYGNLVREVCEFSTIEDFWKYWMYIPKPR